MEFLEHILHIHISIPPECALREMDLIHLFHIHIILNRQREIYIYFKKKKHVLAIQQ